LSTTKNELEEDGSNTIDLTITAVGLVTVTGRTTFVPIVTTPKTADPASDWRLFTIESGVGV
jgi:hypothetical protein